MSLILSGGVGCCLDESDVCLDGFDLLVEIESYVLLDESDFCLGESDIFCWSGYFY